MSMDLLILVLVLAVVGFIIHLITTRIPMDPTFRLIIYVVVAVAMILWLIRRFGGAIPNVL
jgi:hypothetical protein